MAAARTRKTTRAKAPKAAAAGVAEPGAESPAETGAKKPKRRRAAGTGKSLVIVESPAKARTIQKFLGDAFEVRASMGHVRDLPVRGMGIDVAEKSILPRYEIIPDKKKVVDELAKLAADAPTVYLATDLDREGEAIAWHLVQALDVPEERRSRVTFHEITKRAIQEAFEHPSRIDEHRVDAQQARRVLDRLVGYPLSRLLSKAISRGLSAGRVQSVALKLIVDREKEIRAHQAVDYWRVFADLAKPGAGETGAFTADLVHVDEVSDDTTWAADAATPEGTEEDLEQTGEVSLDTADAPAEKPVAGRKTSRELRLHRKEDAEAIVAEIRDAPFVVESVEAKRRSDWAPPPFITSTLQQTASIRLRWPTKRVMKIAQELYEGLAVGDEGATGLITYMRTDSVSLAPEAVGAARSYVAERFGPEFVPEKANLFRSKQGAQEAHEAIRPTDVRRTPQSIRRFLSDEQFALYKLVWERFVACQMAPAEIDTTTVRVRAGRAVFEAKGRVVAFAGWQAVSPPAKKDDEPQLPALAERERLDLLGLRHEQRTTQPPPRYSEATLVKRLEKEGIGRPSTYADIIGKIENRKYVSKLAQKFHATRLGEVVVDRMTPCFPDLMDIGFTRSMEEDLDKVEEGRADWQSLLLRFQGEFEKELETADVEMVKEKFKPAPGQAPCELCGKHMVERFSDGRVFYGCSGYPECGHTRGDGEARKPAEKTDHVCEKCGQGMVIREGRRGRFLACSGYPKCKNAKDLREDGTVVEPVKTGQTCEKCGSEMVLKRGRRGPFLACAGYPACRNARDVNAPAPAPAADGLASLLTTDAPAGAVALAAPAPAGGPLVPLPPCPKCGSPTSIRRSFRGSFCGCTRYPECKGTAPIPAGALPPREPPKPAGVDCPQCGKPMLIRKGKRGPFAGCSGYPKCRGTMPL